MSILITGIDMPTKGNPIAVSIYPDGTAEWEAQHKKGTAVPVPPHGRLGDLDALITTFCERGTSLERKGKFVTTMAEAKQTIVDIIEDAPTIIPAEEEREG